MTDFEFEPSLNATREEYAWIVENLGSFYQEGLITDVLYRVKGGKEANVYCCSAHPSTGLELIAAKIYRPQSHRTMRNDSLYRAGREPTDASGKAIRDNRSLRAIAKRTRHGQNLLRGSWIIHEYQTLKILSAAGADVPRPLEISGSTILMEFVGDRDGAAPILHGVAMDRQGAAELFARAMDNITLMLRNFIIHGDLSPHNILYWQGRLCVIDFPQAVDPLNNPNAFSLLLRDVQRLCDYFRRFGVDAKPMTITTELWKTIGRPEGMP